MQSNQLSTGLSFNQRKQELSPEERFREMERDIHCLIEDSAIIRERGSPGDIQAALEKAKEAGKRERALARLREQQNLTEGLNVDLTYAVCLNLAIQHASNGNENEALTIYGQIVKNKQYPYSGRFRVNIGNLLFQQGKYPSEFMFTSRFGGRDPRSG